MANTNKYSFCPLLPNRTMHFCVKKYKVKQFLKKTASLHRLQPQPEQLTMYAYTNYKLCLNNFQQLPTLLTTFAYITYFQSPHESPEKPTQVSAEEFTTFDQRLHNSRPKPTHLLAALPLSAKVVSSIGKYWKLLKQILQFVYAYFVSCVG